MRSHTRECSNADDAGFQANQLIDMHLQLLEFLTDSRSIGQKRHAVTGQLYTGFVALEESDMPFFLQVIDHAADAGLGVV